MQVLNPGHIYRVNPVGIDHYRKTNGQYLKFVKRGGGAITYSKEWPGVQTQAVMRAVIYFLQVLQDPEGLEGYQVYSLWQLGSDQCQYLTFTGINDLDDVLLILIDRSQYLNQVLVCAETSDAITWLHQARSDLVETDFHWQERVYSAIHCVRMALWCYEARAHRRKQESVNRKHPKHNDSAKLRPWRLFQADDVPFNEIDIEDRPIGPDGHILLKESIS